MMILRLIVPALLACAVLAAAPAASVRVPQAQINAENARWKALGVTVPAGGIVVPHPYAQPYSNRSFVVPYAWYDDFYKRLHAKKVAVNASALRKDLPVLKFLLEKTYAGYGTAASRGWNWNGMFRRWDAQLAHRGKKALTLEQAFAPWGQLEDAQLDNHSGVPGLMAFVSGSASAVLARAPEGSCSALRFSNGHTMKLSARDSGQQPHSVQQWNGSALSPGWYLSYPKRYGAASSVRCGKRDIALTMAAQTPAPSKEPVYSMLADGIAYLRLPTFTDANNEALRTVLSHASDLGKERLVIFDLRGNDGGNAPSDVLTNWFAESAVEIASSMSQSGTTSCFATALQFGLQQQLVGGLKPPVSSGLQQVLQQIADSLKGTSTPDCSVQPRERTGERTLRDHRFSLRRTQTDQTRVVALVDSGCGSDCEYMTYILAGLPDTVLVGTSTYGVMGFTQPGYFVLPYSRIPFRVALSRSDAYGDGRSVDGYGISVDVLLPTAASQSQASLKALAQALAQS